MPVWIWSMLDMVFHVTLGTVVLTAGNQILDCLSWILDVAPSVDEFKNTLVQAPAVPLVRD